MVLNWEDITGVGFLIWIVLTGLFYLVLYMAVLNVTDQKTGNSIIKLPLLLCLSAPGAFLIAIFNYNPMILFFLMVVSNYYRVRDFKFHESSTSTSLAPVNKPLFYVSSFAYLVTLYGLASWFQHPVELDGVITPYWKTWFGELPQ